MPASRSFESRTAINYGHLALFKCFVSLILASHCAHSRGHLAARKRKPCPPAFRTSCELTDGFVAVLAQGSLVSGA